MKRELIYLVMKQEDSRSVAYVLQTKLNLTKHQIRSAKYRTAGICVNGKQVRTTAKVVCGDVVSVLLEEAEEGSDHLEAVPGDLDILYEDEDIIAINKPAGLVVHPAHGHYRDTAANHLMYYFQERDQKVSIRAVGRLDRETSGILVFAKNRVAAARLSGMQEKDYFALVHGRLEEKSGYIELPVKKEEGMLNRMKISDDGSFAGTHYQVLEELGDISFVKLKLDTGRTHQIRVHMAAIGHPLLGDSVYGQAACKDTDGITRTALHCGCVRMIHPFTGEKIELCAGLPEDMRKKLSVSGLRGQGEGNCP